MWVVLDTNVLVSGFLNEMGNPGKILNLLLEDHIRIAYDDRILGEYEDVLARPELKLDHSRVTAILSYIEMSGKWFEAKPFSREGFPDIDDLPFAEVFITSNSEALISGNLRHYQPLIEKGLTVLSPTDFLAQFANLDK